MSIKYGSVKQCTIKVPNSHTQKVKKILLGECVYKPFIFQALFFTHTICLKLFRSLSGFAFKKKKKKNPEMTIRQFKDVESGEIKGLEDLEEPLIVADDEKIVVHHENGSIWMALLCTFVAVCGSFEFGSCVSSFLLNKFMFFCCCCQSIFQIKIYCFWFSFSSRHFHV